MLSLAALCWGCATSPTDRPEQSTTREDGGFTIREDVRVGLGVRGDYERAVDAIEAEDYERGIALLEEITEGAPLVTAAHIDLGIAYRRAGDLEKSEKSIRKALELNPRHPVAHNELGIVLRRSGRFDEARESYETALELFPEFHFARRNLAILCDMYLDDLECAIEHYESYVRSFPEDEAVAMWIQDLRIRAGR